ncbi:hypothetical protein EIN_358100 [Entamoeba invadens IP1]|uniref:Uncharacterized protein n=1 Tax=Entamoeba invadens IP1 TaxID=370355 RepID=A0A0A1TYZ6_ENTIV|nr:hypothetical protein EIN_358100 [Entamoeba invadens IP1]ELP84930.1 hypothetical protein EIN_358100 [Entamoeba invadens IP1]|eukprot:XP_004184276.1 hypothetical protein EIN_358100 [Entamoeba invadens IP1]
MVFVFECQGDKKSCVTFSNKFMKKWMEYSYGIKETANYIKNGSILINVGNVFGGTEQVLEYLHLMEKYINPSKWASWGHDQSVHNYVFYSFYYPKYQIFCFKDKNYLFYDSKNKSLKIIGTNCGPVARHKIGLNNFKMNWSSLEQKF